jgi:ABC-type branched-subunit amino acid transport system ATPase component
MNSLSVRFGSARALLCWVGASELVEAIGRYGAGMTTFFNCVSRLVRGKLRFDASDPLRKRPLHWLD